MHTTHTHTHLHVYVKTQRRLGREQRRDGRRQYTEPLGHAPGPAVGLLLLGGNELVGALRGHAGVVGDELRPQRGLEGDAGAAAMEMGKNEKVSTAMSMEMRPGA